MDGYRLSPCILVHNKSLITGVFRFILISKVDVFSGIIYIKLVEHIGVALFFKQRILSWYVNFIPHDLFREQGIADVEIPTGTFHLFTHPPKKRLP